MGLDETFQNGPSSVGRSVVDDDNLGWHAEVREDREQLVNEGSDRLALVEDRYDYRDRADRCHGLILPVRVGCPTIMASHEPSRPPLISWEAARQVVLGAARALPEERVDLVDADGRVLAGDILAPEDLPAFANSAMDGFAVRAEDLAGGPRTLPLIAPVRAGDPPVVLAAGHSVSISTGAPLPAGADAIVPLEEATWSAQTVDLPGPVAQGRFVRVAGSDITRGTMAIAAGTVIGAPEGGLLAALGISTLAVHRRAVVAVLATGSELVPPAQRPGAGQIRESNATSIAWACRRYGASVRMLGIARDEPDVLRRAIEEGLTADLLITSGGVSVGERDLVRRTLADLGAQEHFWGIALRPGKPCAFATLGETAILGLPGNPASTLVGLALFAAPFIRTLAGDRDPVRGEERAIAAGPWPEVIERDQAVRCRVEHDGDELRATVIGDQSSHRITSLVGTRALAMVPGGTSVSPGDRVRLLRDPWGYAT